MSAQQRPSGPVVRPEFSGFVARRGAECVVTPADPLRPNTVIELDALPWVPYSDSGDPAESSVWTKTVVDPASGHHVMLIRLLPGLPGRAHWHTSDTLYIMRRGELHIDGEGTYGPGSFRWVRGGFAYAPEIPGPEGAEFYFISMGPYGLSYLDEGEPPLGSWRDLTST